MLVLLLQFALANSIPAIQAGYYELVSGNQECSTGNVRWIDAKDEKILVISETYFFNFTNKQKTITKSEDGRCSNTTYTDIDKDQIRVKVDEACRGEASKTRSFSLNYADPAHLMYSGSVSKNKKEILAARCEWKFVK